MLIKKTSTAQPNAEQQKELVAEGNIMDIQESQQETELEKPVTASSKYEGVNFRKMSPEKMFGVIVELIIENKKVHQDNEKLREELLQYNEDIQKSRKQTSGVSDKIDFIAQKICPKVIEMLNDGQKLTLDAKVNIIIEQVLSDKKKLISEILNCRQTLKNQKIVLDELKAQLTQKIEINNKEAIEENKGYTEKDFEAVAGTTTALTEEGQSIQGKMGIRVFDLEKIKNSIDDTGKKILEGIGKEGISEKPALLQYCITANVGITESKFDTAIDNLKQNGVVEVDLVQTFNRIRGISLYNLSNDYGKQIYKEFFRVAPILSEKEKIKQENDNLIHGYSIKDVYIQLKEFGYTNISMDRKSNTIPISGANTWVPDIIATNPYTGRKECFEVELGNHNQTNFNIKLDKANLKTSVLRIIVPNKPIASVVITEVKDWLGKNSKKTRSMTIFVQRFSDLKAKEDGTVFPPDETMDATELVNTVKGNNKPIAKKTTTATTNDNLEEDV